MSGLIIDNFAGGRLEVPVAEVDAADDLLTMTVDDEGRVFVLETKRRN